jgi:ubiquinone/menaquinone biosynthesis C-methylase UbiE
MDAQFPIFRENTFDGISSMLVLWAVEWPKQYLQEHFRMLCPGGTFVLSGPEPECKENYQWHLEEVEKDLRQQGLFPDIQAQWAGFFDYTRHNVHTTGQHWYRHDQIRALCEAVGFEIVSIEPNPVYRGQGHVVHAIKPLQLGKGEDQ